MKKHISRRSGRGRKPRALPLLALSSIVLLTLSSCDAGSPAQPPRGQEAVAAQASPAAGSESQEPSFDYPGGWLDSHTCVDICGVTPESPVERPPAVVCFDKEDAACAAKTGEADFDYLMLSQHWLPAMCKGLAAGYDTTVTHQAGARCTEHAPSRLSLHGLWQNYTAGFPQCCGAALPLDPRQVRAWPQELADRLQQEQPDPTTTGFEPAICEIFNHEWQKHGTCFANTGDTDADARKYFETGLELSDRLAEANAQLNAWAGTPRDRSAIESLYPKAVQVLCDSRQVERLLEIHTCWSRELEMIDCPSTEGFGSLKACGDEVTLTVWG